jgi:hypothetical protein
MGTQFVAQGEDAIAGSYRTYTSSDRKYTNGYLIGPEQYMLAQADLINYNKEAKMLYFGFEFEYIDGHLGSDSVVSAFSVLGCNESGQLQATNSSGFQLDEHGISYTDSPKFTVLHDSTIFGARK